MSEEVSFWLHCARCIKEVPVGMSPKEYSRQQSGVTEDGRIIVWCNRHEMEVGTFVLEEGEMDQFEGMVCPECQKGVIGHTH